MANIRRGIIHKSISIAAIAVMALYVCYSAAAVSADICLCREMLCSSPSVENKANPNTEHCCCCEEEAVQDCCSNDIPVQNEIIHSPFDMSAYRNNISDVQTGISDSLILVELSSIDCEEQITPQYISFFIFRPPKV